MGCSTSGKLRWTASEQSPLDFTSGTSAEAPKELSPVGVPEDGITPPAINRNSKHIFEIVFEKKPIGVSLTSARDGRCAYVTQANGTKNKAVKSNRLPVKSKLLLVNRRNVEMATIDKTTRLILESMDDMPLKLTFCHPDGLGSDEIADPNPHGEIGKG